MKGGHVVAKKTLESQSATPALEIPAPLETGEWAGIPNYTCAACGYANVDLEKAREFVANCTRCNAGEEVTNG
jgi:hypothetical protein